MAPGRPLNPKIAGAKRAPAPKCRPSWVGAKNLHGVARILRIRNSAPPNSADACLDVRSVPGTHKLWRSKRLGGIYARLEAKVLAEALTPRARELYC